MRSSAVEKFRGWVERSAPTTGVVAFRIAFAAIWLTYDVADLALEATQRYRWTVGLIPAPRLLPALQLALIACELGLLLGRRARSFALAACGLRAVEASLFALNDFLAYCVLSLCLSQTDCESGPESTATGRAWPRDVLVLQAAWIYFASALLKLNVDFLSGGDLFVRQRYLASILHWPYPALYVRWISTPAGNAGLAWLAVLAELTLALVLLGWWLRPSLRAGLHRAALGLALAIHGFAALALNVFAFGATMVALVACAPYVRPGDR